MDERHEFEGSTAERQIKPYINQSRQLLIQAHEQLQLKNEQIQLLVNENAELLEKYKTEKEARQRLETDLSSAMKGETREIAKKLERCGVTKINDKEDPRTTSITVSELSKQGWYCVGML
uniref:Uncharacterized protein n=1 Tax=Spongospora subterranea TaxID=70186 RepID=A0A0H5R8Q5_9EUKA|eukprot:CRZ04749.1 hypothetical protein [Spongospora subterranea]